jgi:hypothetical protein
MYADERTERLKMRGLYRFHRRLSASLCAFLLLALPGCRSAPPNSSAPPPIVAAGEILRVNAAEGLVVVHAAVLPEAGQEATVFGKEGVVGRIRFTSALRLPYCAAEILEGRPQRGDRFRVDPAAQQHRSTP